MREKTDTEPLSEEQNVIRIGYVMKRYPRFSETFIVNEILAHEAAGLDLEIFALRPTIDTHFQNAISQVRAPVNYLPFTTVKSAELWKTCHGLSDQFPELWAALASAKHATVGDAYQAIRLAQQIRKKKINHLHAHFATSAASVTQIAARIAGISYSVTMHAKDIFHEDVEHEDLANKIAAAKFVVTVSDFNRDYLIHHFGFQEKILRIYNGLDLDVFNFNPTATPQKKIISVGRLVPKKGLCHLIDACRILVDREVDFVCEIIGTGELEFELRSQIERLSLGKWVQLTGPQPQNVVREKIASSTVFAAPCIIGPDGNRDGLPTVITESLAIGTPCVSTDVTGIPEIIRHDVTGLQVRQGNSQELAAQLQRLLEAPALGEELASQARQLIETDFDIHKNVAQLRSLFLSPTSRRFDSQPNRLQGV